MSKAAVRSERSKGSEGFGCGLVSLLLLPLDLGEGVDLPLSLPPLASPPRSFFLRWEGVVEKGRAVPVVGAGARMRSWGCEGRGAPRVVARPVLWKEGQLELKMGVNWYENEPCKRAQRRAGVAQQRVGGPDGLHGGGVLARAVCWSLVLGRRRQKFGVELELPHQDVNCGLLGEDCPASLMGGDLAMTVHRFTQSGRVA